MSVGSLLRRLYLSYFSQPTGDRALYRAASCRPIRSIVELGIGPTRRTQQLLDMALGRAPGGALRYTGIDLFEARPAGSSELTLKQAFAALKRTGVQLQLVPGLPDAALKRIANSLTHTDLLLISAEQDCESLSRAWLWMPRMLTPASLVFVETPGARPGQISWRRIELAEIRRLAAETGKSVRHAA